MTQSRSRTRDSSSADSRPLVSVVIPCYNQAHFLGEAIESVLSQSYPNFEIIVVDDGSPDDTAEVAARYPEVRYVRQDNQGVSVARNSGLARSGGAYIVFLDADDRLLPEALEVGVRELEAHPECALVFGYSNHMAANGTPLFSYRPHVEGDHYLELLRYNYISPSAVAMYRRDVFDSVGGFDPSLRACQDYDFYLRIARRFPIHGYDRVVVDYRQHDTNRTRNPAIMLSHAITVLRSQRKHIKGNKRYEEAWKTGVRTYQQWDGERLVDEVRTNVRERERGRALRGMLVLLRYYPQGLALLNERRMERHVERRSLTRRLERREEELRTHEQRLRDAESAQELGSTLVKEREKVERLRQRIGKLEQQMQDLNQHSLWKRLKNPGRIRAKIFRKSRRKLGGAKQVAPTEAAPTEAFRGLRSGDTAVGMEQKPRFFVVGEMRSGTTWLMQMLNSHPEILCKGDGSFFGRNESAAEIPVYKAPTPSLYSALVNCEELRTWQSLSWNGWSEWTDAEEDSRNLARLAIDYYLAKGSAASGKRIIGDKSPLHTDHVDEIFDLYPEAKVIHIFRDGRDVAVSLMHHFWSLARDMRGGIYEGLEPEELAKRDTYLEDPESFLASGNSIFVEERLRQIAARWSRRVSKASREGPELFGSNFLQISYEDLLERPEENIKAVFEFLGARADDRIVHRCIERIEDNSFFLKRGVAGDWRRVFTERDRRVYQEIAGETLLKMGYPLD